MEYTSFQLCPRLQKKTVVVDATHKVYAMSFERTSADTLHIAIHSLKKNQNLNRSHRDSTACNMVKGIPFVPARTKWSIPIG